MKKGLQKLFLALLVSLIFFSSAATASLLQQLVNDMNDNSLDTFSLIEAAFILSGVDWADSLAIKIAWYDSVVQQIKDFHLDFFDPVGAASKIFSYLHSTWLISYREKSTTLLDVIERKEYNCVAGTILYNLICSNLGLSTAAFETPTHVYTIFTNFSQKVMVENTSPMGFDIMKNLKAYSHYLAQFYPKEQIYQIGLDRLYAYENTKGREITNMELLGLLAYNRAYFSKEQGDYRSAYNFVLLAQDFNQDSRSNVNFEIDLYFRWGKVLFDEEKFKEAFSVYADATYRYPFNKDFAHNCEVAFRNALIQKWRMKDWKTTCDIVQNNESFNILSEKSLALLKNILIEWRYYFEILGDQDSNLEAQKIYSKYFGVN